MSWNGTVTCGWCRGRGHNKRGCNDYKRHLKTTGCDRTLKALTTRKCGWCKQTGHNVQTCPDKKNSKVRLAELEPLLKSHVENILRMVGLGRGAVISKFGYNDGKTMHGIVLGAHSTQQRIAEPCDGSRVHCITEPHLRVLWQGATHATQAYLPQAPFQNPTAPTNWTLYETDRLSTWGYDSTKLVAPSSEPLPVEGGMVVSKGQSVDALEKWIKLLTESVNKYEEAHDRA